VAEEESGIHGDGVFAVFWNVGKCVLMGVTNNS
jgi:hypothetical protein